LGGVYDPTIIGSVRLTSKKTPWNDPPQGGGYAQGFGGGSTPDNSYPFYYDQNIELAGHEDGSVPAACTLAASAGNTLTFHDAPNDMCLPGGADTGTALCQDPVLAPGATAEPTGSVVGFMTHLAGVNFDGTATDLGIGFMWTSNYNGSTGNARIIKTDLPADNNGTGGITITSVNQVTNYEFPRSLGITSINGTAINSQAPTQILLGGNEIQPTTSGLAYSRLARTFNGTITITNISNNPIDGPFHIVLTSLTPGVVLTNATGSFGGFPYLTVMGVSDLAAGQAAAANIQFSNPSFGAISFIPITYSGALN
jgi:hypothetical protein